MNIPQVQLNVFIFEFFFDALDQEVLPLKQPLHFESLSLSVAGLGHIGSLILRALSIFRDFH